MSGIKPHRNGPIYLGGVWVSNRERVFSFLFLLMEVIQVLYHGTTQAARVTEKATQLAASSQVQLTGIKGPARRSGLLEAFFGPMKSAQCCCGHFIDPVAPFYSVKSYSFTISKMS